MLLNLLKRYSVFKYCLNIIFASSTTMSSKKNNKVKFLLAPRPQRDPLAADFEAPQNVLIPHGQDVGKIKERFKDLDPDVFVSETETRKGMLERAHQSEGLVLDPDILKAMSTEFDYNDPNNVIDDDFFEQAGGLIADDDEEFEEFDLDNLDEELEKAESSSYQPQDDIVMSQDHGDGGDDDEDDDDDDEFEDTKTVFTNYSLTSSVLRRNQGLQQIDEHFERLYEKQYANDSEIGDSESTNVEGQASLTNHDQIRKLKREVTIARKRDHDHVYQPEIVSDHHKNAIIGDSEEQDLVEVEVTRRENRVDCESILSNCSTLFNHPKLIVEPRKRNKSDRMDVDMDDARSRSERSESIASRVSVLSKLSIRPDNESIEEKRDRKKALKQYRRERRQERKQNEKIFKLEKANIAKQERNNKPVLRLA